MRLHRPQFVVALGCLITCAHLAFGQQTQATRATNPRIVKSFDFDERKFGNFESLPMNWLRIDEPGFPSFLEPAFDMESGRTAAPSFGMAIQTGNVGAYYRAKDIVADANSEYRITVWVKTEQLKHAGAVVTAFYYDHNLTKIEATERRSASVRTHGEWTRVHVDLPGGNPRARWIGLSCRIEQPAVVNQPTADMVPIHYTDVDGRAWFDDITIMRRPRVSLTLDRADHLYRHDETVTCHVQLFDVDGVDLDIELSVDDAAGRSVLQQSLTGQSLIGDARAIAFDRLAAGIYDAHLTMSLRGKTIANHVRRFAVLSQPSMMGSNGGGPFGLVLHTDDMNQPGLIDIIERLNPSLVKVPVWSHKTNDANVVFGDQATRDLIKRAVNLGISVVAMLAETPDALLPDVQHPPRPDALLAGNKDWVTQWEPYLNIITSRYGGYVDHWQLGTDASAPMLKDKTLTDALMKLRSYLAPLVGSPQVIAPQDALQAAGKAAQLADIQTVFMPPHVDPVDEANDSTKQARRWATLELADEDRYQRVGRLARFARRLLHARAAGFERVFIAPPWAYDEIDGQRVIRPREEAVIFHALAQAVSGQDRIERLTLDPNLETWLFSNADGSRATLALWSSDESLRQIELDLPDGARHIDAWGHALPTTETNGWMRVAVGPMPQLLTGVQPAALRFQDSFELDDDAITVAIEEHQRTLRLKNTFAEDLEGELVIDAPRGWRITPRRIDLRLRPNEMSETTVFIKPPVNETIGTKRLFATIKLGKRGPGRMWTPLNVVAPGLEVSVFGHIEGESVRFFQRVTNRSNEPIDLRSYLIAPELPRLSRSIRSLGVGETAVREYVYPSAAQLNGRPVRLSLEEIGGALRHNEVLRVPYEPDAIRSDVLGGNSNRLDISAAARAFSNINGE